MSSTILNFFQFFSARRAGERELSAPRSPRPIAGTPAWPATRLRGLPSNQVSFCFLLSFDGLIIAHLCPVVNIFFKLFDFFLGENPSGPSVALPSALTGFSSLFLIIFYHKWPEKSSIFFNFFLFFFCNFCNHFVTFRADSPLPSPGGASLSLWLHYNTFGSGCQAFFSVIFLSKFCNRFVTIFSFRGRWLGCRKARYNRKRTFKRKAQIHRERAFYPSCIFEECFFLRVC